MDIEEINELKDKLIDAVGLWADDRITRLASENPRLSVASVYIKRGIKNYLHREKERIGKAVDNAILFISDENGQIELRTIFDDAMRIFQNMDEVPFSIGFAAGTIGKGIIRIQIPDNMFTSILFGDLGCLKITESDIQDLFDLIAEQHG